MRERQSNTILGVSLIALGRVGVAAAPPAPPPPAPPPAAPPAAVRITLEEATQRALANNKLLIIGSLNAESKEYAIRAARSDYFPKVVGSVFYLHFQDD